MQHTHTLTSGLVGILVKIIKAVQEKNRNCVHIQKDLDLSHTEFCNLQKLRYWGLITHYKENGEKKAGYWLITSNGGKFLKNKLSIPYKVSTQDNVITGKSPEERIIRDFYPAYETAWFQSNWSSVNILQPALF